MGFSVIKIGAMIGMLFLSRWSYAETFEFSSVSGKKLVLTSDDEFFSEASSGAKLCSNVPTEFKKVKLWMPDHGHGSTPTSLVKIDEYCTRVEKLNFVMSGNWDFQISFSDGDRASQIVGI